MKVIPLFKNESQLIARAAKGNRRAQQELYRLHSGKMLGVCRMYIKDLQQAEEVMLSGFFKVFTHLGNFRGEGSFEGWIRRIMVRECISFLRKRQELEFVDDLASEEGEGFNSIEADMDVEQIQRLIDELPEGYRMVFVMYAIEGYRHKEIAEMLKIDAGTSKSQLFKARKLLQQRLETLKQVENETSGI